MRRFALPLLAVLFLPLLAGAPSELNLLRSVPDPQDQTEKRESQAVEHQERPQNAMDGKYVGDRKTRKAGHRPAYGKACGLDF